MCEPVPWIATNEAAPLVAVFDEACPERSRRVGTTNPDGFAQRSNHAMLRTMLSD